MRKGERTYFFAFDLAPLLHSASSAEAFLPASAAAFWFATSAFWESRSSVTVVSDGKTAEFAEWQASLPLRCQRLSWCFRRLPFWASWINMREDAEKCWFMYLDLVTGF
jgi:hypothetical protein